MDDIDSQLDDIFSPERIKQAYWDFKESKRDLFSEEPKFRIAMGADGVSFSAFERQLERHAKNISQRIRDGKYFFYPFREVDKPKESVLPSSANLAHSDCTAVTDDSVLSSKLGTRTLSVASIRDSLVQRLLYEMLYSYIEPLFSPLDNPFPASFAYRKHKSAPKAAVLVHDHIQHGYWYVLDADISRYFDTISHDLLLEKVSTVIDPASRTFALLHRFIHTDRIPHSSYKGVKRRGKLVGAKVFHWRKPRREKRSNGIPQGGVLSGMLANLFLHDFDQWIIETLGHEYDIRYVRYADDSVILARNPDALVNIQTAVEEKLQFLGLTLNLNKTRHIDVRNMPLEFVGFEFDGKLLRVRFKNVFRFKDRALYAIRDASDHDPEEVPAEEAARALLKRISRRLNHKITGYSGARLCQICHHERVGPPRSWIAFFRVVTDKSQIKQLDRWIRDQIYDAVYSRHNVRLGRSDLRQAGLRSLMNECYRVRQTRRKPCICDLEHDGLDSYLKDLFEGRYYRTLARQKPFRVNTVSPTSLHIQIDRTVTELPRAHLVASWEKLIDQGRITRSEIESSGFLMASQIAALLSVLPAVEVATESRIQLIYTRIPK